MSTASANATPLPSRRNLIAQAGMFAAVTATGASVLALPAFAGEHGPIEAMWPEYLRLEGVFSEATYRLGDAEDLFEELPLPLHHLVDEGASKAIAVWTDNSDHMKCLVHDVGDENIAYLKSLIAMKFEPDDDLFYQHERRAGNAKKTLAEIEAWRSEVKCRKDAAGLTEAEAAFEAAAAARSAHCEAMLDIKATTYREVAFQAAIVVSDWCPEWAETVIDRLVKLAGITPWDVG